MHTTRRTLFTGAAALSAVAVMPALPTQPIAEIWAEAVALAARINANPTGRDEESDPLFALEDAVLFGPILSRADALAKLRASAGLAFERSERMDGADEPAFEEAMRWLEAH